jgi:Xaa-Pro aminopeptidase
MYTKRFDKVKEHLQEREADWLLVSDYRNIAYLCGFWGTSVEERESLLMIGKEGMVLIIPRMYEETARLLPLIQDSTVTLAIDKERDGLFRILASYVRRGQKLIFENSNIRYSEYQELAKMKDATCEPASQTVEKMREQKQPEEIALIKQAIDMTDRTFNHLVTILREHDYTQYTEQDIVEIVRTYARSIGAEGLAFEPVVACGAGSAQPHHHPRTRYLSPDAVLLIDLGITYRRYHGDLTRCIFLGGVSKKAYETYQLVYECNQVCIAACRPGIQAGELFDTAVSYFDTRGVASRFIHGLGHGIGLNVHEGPFLRSSRNDCILPGMVFTIEPGLYYPGAYGIRIEDVVMVTDDGCEVLSQASRDVVCL